MPSHKPDIMARICDGNLSLSIAILHRLKCHEMSMCVCVSDSLFILLCYFISIYSISIKQFPANPNETATMVKRPKPNDEKCIVVNVHTREAQRLQTKIHLYHEEIKWGDVFKRF